MTSEPVWQERTQSLNYTVGDYCLFRILFLAKVADEPLSSYFKDQNLTQHLIDEIGKDSVPYVIRSYPTVAPLPKLTKIGRYIRYVGSQEQRYYIDLRGNFIEYLGKFSPKSRNTLGRKVRRAAKIAGGTVDWYEYSRPEEMAKFHELGTALSRRTYQENLAHQGLASYAPHPKKLITYAEEDAARGYILFDHGKPIAYVFCRRHSSTLIYEIVGYDPDYSNLSPGSVLLYLIIEKLFTEKKFEYLDFGEGVSWYKEFFSTDSATCARIYFFPMRPFYLIAVAVHITANGLSSFLGRTLSLFGLRDRLRRLLRTRSLPDGI
jgi:CelD/BcsL family acetyltransferase involved in cellulose biosynthesis